jgi:small-conductance mechanosensitive channel
VIELDGRLCRVDKISLRATIVRTLTNEELVIPNSKFTTELVKNLTKSDRLVRVIVPLGVSYDDDPELVRDITIETARQHPLVLVDPAPILLFRGYGESSLDFNLSVSIDRPELSAIVRSDLYYALWKVFAEHDITIPFPQRDLNLGDGWQKSMPELQVES